MQIDMNRPLVTKLSFEKDGSYGPRIHMYLDKPGVYLDSHGKEVPAVVAKRAGFDIEQDMVAQAVMNEQERLMARYQSIVGPKAPHVIEETRPLGHTLVRVGADQYHIEDAEGKRVTSTQLSRSYAVMWLDDIDPYGAEEMPDEVDYPLEVEAEELDLPVEEEEEPEAVKVEPAYKVRRKREEEPVLFPAKTPPKPKEGEE